MFSKFNENVSCMGKQLCKCALPGSGLRNLGSIDSVVERLFQKRMQHDRDFQHQDFQIVPQ
jgi:hypothetical protein